MTSQPAQPSSQARYYHDKKAFLQAQVRLLQAPSLPAEDWARHQSRLAADSKAQAIPAQVITAALAKLHVTSTKSLRLSFNHQSIRQLLEQLEAHQHELRKKARQGGIIIRTKTVPEILESDWIDVFPETWQHHQDIEGGSTDGVQGESSNQANSSAATSSRLQKYADLRSRIVSLQTKYKTLREKHSYYKTLQGEIARLDASKVEANIVSPNSQVAQELKRMQVLLPRVLGILDSRRDAISAKRAYQSQQAGQSDEAIKRRRIEAKDPSDALKDFFSK